MSRKSQVVTFLRQQGRNRIEQADLLKKGHNPNAEQLGKMREAARLFEDAAKMCEAFEGPVSVTSDASYRESLTAAREKEAEEAKEPVEKEKVVAEVKPRKKWTRRAIEEAKQGPAIARNDKD